MHDNFLDPITFSVNHKKTRRIHKQIVYIRWTVEYAYLMNISYWYDLAFITSISSAGLGVDQLQEDSQTIAFRYHTHSMRSS